MPRFAAKSHAAPAFQTVPSSGGPRADLPVVRAILRGPRIQPKLTIGAVNDPAEREADQVAGQVMRMPDRAIAAGSGAPPIESRDGGIRRLCADCENEKEGAIQRRAANESAKTPDTAPRSVHDVLRSPGRPLDAGARAFMEPRFGLDFGGVRVHTGPEAAESARSIQALAYTSGRDVVFGAGQYAPETESGRRVLAHELTHVVQQNTGPAGPDTVHRQVDPETLPLSPRSPPVRSPGDPLPYREATEFSECLRIMGEENVDYCAQTVLGEKPGSRIPRKPSVTTPLIITLQNVSAVPRFRVLEATIRQALEPIANAAGRKLEFNRLGPGHLTLDFDGGGHASKPCGLLILGNEGGGEIFVGAHEDLRVCNGPQGHPSDPGGVDHTSQFKNVFDKDEPEFAQFVGSTAVHELAHTIAQLPHTADRNNFMLSVGSLGANLPQGERTLASMRKHWSEQKSFTPGQVALLQEAIRTGQFSGGMTTARTPPTPPITPKGPKTPTPPTAPKKP